MDADMVWTDLEEMRSAAAKKSQVNCRSRSSIWQIQSRVRDSTQLAVVDTFL